MEQIGEYVIRKTLGRGLAGEVYLAEKDGQQFALKTLLQSSENQLQAFRSEFEVLRILDHPHIAKIYDYGHESQHSFNYTVSEYVDGKTLGNSCEDLSLLEKQGILIQILQTLAAIHSQNVIHFDLKPENILLTNKKNVKLIDFGLVALGRKGLRVGSPGYMAPEMILKKPVDQRVDLYSFGVLALELFLGENPFMGITLQETLQNHTRHEFQNWKQVSEQIPEGWQDVLKKLLMKRPGDRYSHAAFALRDLSFLTGLKIEQVSHESLALHSGPFLGRDQEWREFQLSFDKALRKIPTTKDMFYVSGEKGVGKKRFLFEIKSHAQLANATVFQGLDNVQLSKTTLNVILLNENDVDYEDAVLWFESQLDYPIYLVFAQESLPQGVESLKLENFNREQVATYLQGTMGWSEVPKELLDHIYSLTQGNLFFLKEVLSSFQKQKILCDESGYWDVSSFQDDESWRTVELPATIEGHYRHAIQELTPERRLALAVLSLSYSDLDYLGLEDQIKHDCVFLERAGLLTKENHKVKNVLIADLSDQEKKKCHEYLAELYHRRDNESARDYHQAFIKNDRKTYLEKLKELLKSFDYQHAPLMVRELEKNKLNHEEVVALADYHLATFRYDKASELLSLVSLQGDSNDAPFLDKKIRVCLKQERYDEAQELVVDAQKRQLDVFWKAVFQNHEAFIAFRKGDVEMAESLFLKTQNTNGVHTDKIDNDRLLDVYLFQEKWPEAISLCDQKISDALKHEDSAELAKLYYAQGDLLYRFAMQKKQQSKKDYLSAVKSLQIALECAQKMSYQDVIYSCENALGNVFFHIQNYQKAEQSYQRAFSLSRRQAKKVQAAFVAYNLSNTYAALENEVSAFSHLHYAYQVLEKKSELSPHERITFYLVSLGLAQFYKDRGQSEDFKKVLEGISGWTESYDYLKTYQGLEEDLKKNKKSSPKKEKKMLDSNQSLQRDLDRLIEINNLINSENNLETLLSLVLRYALQLTQAEYGFVLLCQDDDRDQLEIVASVNARAEEQEKISMSIAKMALERGETVSSDDAVTDERFDQSRSIVLNELKSVLCLPIRSRQKTIGVFYLDNHFQTNAFENSNLVVLRAFCDQVGIALENTKLIQELSVAKEKLQEELSETEQELSQVRKILNEESVKYKSKYSYKNILSRSQNMTEIFRLLDKVTETNLSIFIHGESGTGKELFAKALHYNHPKRKKQSFMAVNCGAIPENLMESELFGHKAGSFTGATRDKKGIFEEANGGTLFLDEIGELPMAMQVKLLRVLQEGEVQRVGESQVIKVDVRVVSASHQDLEKLIEENRFREDLFYRLCQMKIDLPALRDRVEDIPILAEHFVKKYCDENDVKKSLEIPSSFLKALMEYPWPGNIRELENLISVACALQENHELSLANLPSHYGIVKNDQSFRKHESQSAQSLHRNDKTVLIDEVNTYDPNKTWRDYEVLIYAKCYEVSEKKKKKVAELLDVSPSTVYKKIDDLNLEERSAEFASEAFQYNPSLSLKDYIEKIFLASLEYFGNKPYTAIKNLGVSQGYFYKVMKKVKEKS